ncbi:MAG: GtrA family protein [Anaerolineae bacterium]|nr:MAG: GtrA family protein [Anaerolineae bacterium]
MLTNVISLTRDKRKELVRFFKFAIVGTVGTVVDFGVLNLLIQLASLAKFWANTCSFTAAVISNFTWNRLWTFPESRERPLLPQLGQFALVNVAGLAINQAIFLGLDQFVLGEAGLLATTMAGLAETIGVAHFTLAYNLAKAIAIIVVLFWNFGVNRIWTYRGIK